MKVFIVGSMQHITDRDQIATMEKACEALGEALVTAGHIMILGSDALDTVDYHLVQGAEKSKQKGPFVVHVYRPLDEHRQTPYASTSLKKVKIGTRTDYVNQTAAHIAACNSADVVILMGGGTKTIAAADAAVALRKEVLAIPIFGGAAYTIWQKRSSSYLAKGVSQPDYEKLYQKLGNGFARFNHQSEQVPRALGPARISQAIASDRETLYFTIADRHLDTLGIGRY